METKYLRIGAAHSYLIIHLNRSKPLTNFQILYRLGHFKKARKILDKYPAVHLYLDGYGAGRKYTHYVRNLHKRYADLINPYNPFKDLNECLMYTAHLEKREAGP